MNAFEIWKNKVNNTICNRTNPVKINWYTLDNSQLLDLYSKCKGELEYSAVNLENWKDMFQVMDGDLKECYYINDIVRLFFASGLKGSLNENTRKANANLLKIRSWMDNKADTIIFVPVGNAAHNIFANMIKHIAGDTYNVYVLDGNNTTNANCEEESLRYSINARKNNKKCIYISSTMGNRSWSNPYVKNCILLVDNPSYDSTYQKFARTLTPWTDENGKIHDNANIFDFRLQYDSITPSEKYLGDILERKDVYTDAEVNEILEKIEGSDKIAFFRAYANIENPLHKLSAEEIRKMISTPNFVAYRFGRIVNNWNIAIPEKKITIKSDKMESTNVKGDGAKVNKVRKNKSKKDSSDNDIQEDENRQLILDYIKYILNNPKVFRMDGVNENPIEYICNNIDKRKDYIENVCRMSFNTVKDIFTMMVANKNLFNEDIFLYEL